MGGPLADTPLLAALLSSISAIHSCHLVAPSPHSEDPQVRAGGWLVTGDPPPPPHPKTAPADLMWAPCDPSIGSVWYLNDFLGDIHWPPQ